MTKCKHERDTRRYCKNVFRTIYIVQNAIYKNLSETFTEFIPGSKIKRIALLDQITLLYSRINVTSDSIHSPHGCNENCAGTVSIIDCPAR